MKNKNSQVAKIATARIVGMGSSFPERIVTSEDTEKRIKMPKGWIFERTGILARRMVSEGEQNSDIAAKAAQEALLSAGCEAKEVDLILACTSSPDRWMPGLAHAVQARIGAENAAAYDIVTACAGWLAGVQAADSFIRAGTYKKVLVVASEAMSRFINWEDKTTCVLFGDGAGASLLCAGKRGEAGEVIDILLRSDGRHGDILEIPGTGSRLPASQNVIDKGLQYVRMDGEKIFSSAVRRMSEICEEVLQKHSFTIRDVDWLVPHQANSWIVKLVGERLDIPSEKVAMNIEKYGNTTAATVPTCLDEYTRSGRIKRGDLVLVTTFGAGLSWAGGLIRW